MKLGMKKKQKTSLRNILYKKLLFSVVGAALISSVGVFFIGQTIFNNVYEIALEKSFSKAIDSFEIFDHFVSRVENDAKVNAALAFIELEKRYPTEEAMRQASREELVELAKTYKVSEIYLIVPDGHVVNTTFEADQGLDLFSLSVTFKNFLIDLKGTGVVASPRLALSSLTGVINSYHYYSPTGSTCIFETSTSLKEGITNSYPKLTLEKLFNLLFYTSHEKNTLPLVRLVDLVRTDTSNKQFLSLFYEGNISKFDSSLLKDLQFDQDVRVQNKGMEYVARQLSFKKENTTLYGSEYVGIFEINRTYITNFRNYSLLAVFCLTVFASWLAFIFVRRTFSIQFSERVENIVSHLEQIENGSMDIMMPVSGNDELDLITKGISSMALSILEKNKELKELENYLSNIIDSMPSILIGVDKNNIITQWNQEAVKKIGLSKEDSIGTSFEKSIPRMASEMVQIKDLIKNRQMKYESKVIHEINNKTIYEDITIYPLLTNGVEGAVIRIDDVTKKHELEQQLNQSRKMDAIGQLAGGVAHDFNNMLAGIMGAAQLLQFPQRNLDEKGLKFVKMIIEASQRASDLTAKLLAFGRKGKITSTSIDIHKIIDDTLALFNRTIDKKINISILKNAENSTVIGDNSALQNSLLNLGINASHAMPDGGRLTIGTRNLTLNENYCKSSPFEISEGEYVEIEVRDTGNGISPENIKRIFEPFFTTKEQGKGTGLGLASVYGTIQNHHGAINVNSEIGTGTVFHIYLPCSDKVVKKVSTEEIVSHGSGLILMVDDEELIRVTGKYTLEGMGYKVILAKNGLEAVEIFKKRNSEINFVIMDMIMPIMNGTEAFHKMKEIDKNCKVIISSGFTKDENLHELKEAGLAGFIQKPFMDYELSKLLDEVME